MNTILRTDEFDSWLSKLKDFRGKARIIERIKSAERGNFGDCSPVGEGVSEMRIHFGKGYRVYYKLPWIVITTKDESYDFLIYWIYFEFKVGSFEIQNSI